MEHHTISNKDFHSNQVGRGIWHLWHSIGFSAKTTHDISILYEIILMYNTVIRCEECREHSNQYIAITHDSLYATLTNFNLTDSEIIEYFNRWLYEYHKHANIHAKLTSPSYEDVAEYYLNFESCKECSINK